MLISLTPQQKVRIARLFRSKVEKHGRTYSVRKYPPAAYLSYQRDFSSLLQTAPVSDALLWKYGKAGRSSYTRQYNSVIVDATKAWPKFVSQQTPEQTFRWWHDQLGRKRTRYITAAYLTHLIEHKRGVPIVDQHNVRASNRLLRQINVPVPATALWKAPSTWADIESVGQVIKVIAAETGLSGSDVDRALMMYGAFLKKRFRRER